MDPTMRAIIRRIIDDLETKARQLQVPNMHGASGEYVEGFKTGKSAGLFQASMELEKVLQDA
ncbi:hypothetical protein PM3016_5464 [Paenibacillus mucilaginosus 3016]|uniref:Uncharacterized protein n=1 Tax=Paenibacillus mucilaginosus 3016 TaxID=1116391 RepID=H6NDW5_9BACL|nr:hypothetical protein [Paenibacillus mucilaginosus]AFC32164.1 hypothetical protein PM3016_5464 [Paenibacillus mucilaginosus 3016]WFA20662.1 hypothetical protein ERY13_27185 [Paenibacillus mucilaginosus]